MEHIVHSNIMDHFDKNKILTNVQHGFRKKRSCESQLIVTIHEIASKLEKGSFVEMVHDVAVDYMLQYLTCDGGEGNRSIVGG
jgi:transcriptional regulator NrdR family protein